MPEYKNNDIIFNVEYHQKYADNFIPKNDYEKKYYEKSLWQRSSSSVSYITRDSACDNKLEEENKLIDDLVNFTDLNESEISKLSNLNSLEDLKCNGFSSLGDLNKENKLKLEKELKQTGSTIWSSFISFTPEYSNNFCSNKIEAKDLIENISKSFFKASGLNPDNIEWYASFHNNTPDHNHIHFVWFEKEPMNLNSKGVAKYSNSLIPTQALNKMLANIYEFHHQQNHDYFCLRDEIRKEVKSSIKEIYFQKFLKDFSTQFKSIGSYQYDRLTNENKLLLNNAFKTILDHNGALKDKYNDYLNRLYSEQRELQKMWKMENKDQKIRMPKRLSQYANSRIAELYKRCGNTILQSFKTWENNKRQRKHYRSNNPFANHNNCKSASNVRKYNSKLATQIKNSCIAMFDQNIQEDINHLFDRSIKEFYDKLMKEELEATKEKTSKSKYKDIG